MKTIITIILIFTSITMLSNDIKIDVKKKDNLVQTFSGKLSAKKGFQAFLLNNSEIKAFELISFFIDNGKINPLEKVVFKNKISIISYHLNNNMITMLITEERKGIGQNLRILDIDTKTQKHSIKDLGRFDPTKTILAQADKTFIFYKKKLKLFFSIINDGNNIKDKQYEIEDEHRNIMRPFFKEAYFTAINSNDYVKNGSININTMYFNNNNIYFINLDKRKKLTNVLRFDFNNLENFKTITINNNDKAKDFNSYLYDNNIVTLVSGKEDAEIKIIDFDNEKTKFKTSLVNNLSSILDNDMLSEFIEKSSKSKFKPTITVNHSIDDNIVVNIDFVEKGKYQYSNNWDLFWMMQHQMMQHQSMIHMQNMQQNFGPSIQEDFIPFFLKEKTKTLMQFVISHDYKILKNASTKTKYKNIDIKNYMEDLKTDKSKKSANVLFTDDNYYIIYYNKKNREINLKKLNYKL